MKISATVGNELYIHFDFFVKTVLLRANFLKFIIQRDPLPEFNAYTLRDVIKNFWIVGVMLILAIPMHLFGVLYRFVKEIDGEDDWDSPSAILLHVVIC